MISDGLKTDKNKSKTIRKKLFRKRFFGWKTWQKRDFWSKKSQKINKMELSWHTEMVDSLKNQKELVWNDSNKNIFEATKPLAQKSKKEYFFIKKWRFWAKNNENSKNWIYFTYHDKWWLKNTAKINSTDWRKIFSNK